MRIQGIRENDPAMADMYTTIYTSATGSYDLYALFTEKALTLTKDDAYVNFIMPVKWTNAAFGKGLRKVVSTQNAIARIVNFGSFMVFDVSTYTGLQWFKKHTNMLEYVEINDKIATSIELSDYLNGITEESFNKIPTTGLSEESWVLSDDSILSIIDKLNKQPRRISDIFDKIFQGLATSKDDVYFLYECKLDDRYVTGFSKYLDTRIKIERGLIKPLLKGEDVHRYETVESDRFVIFPYRKEKEAAILYTEQELESEFPLGYAYLKQCEAALRGREKGRFNLDGEWFQYGRKQGISSAECKKLVAPEISKGGNFSYDIKGEFYSTTKIYGYIKKDGIIEDYKFWLGLLNSQLFWFFIQNTGYVLRGGYFTFKTDYIQPFPVPEIIPVAISEAISNAVNRILELKEEDNENDTSELENGIDKLIYSLYDLDESEVGIIKTDSLGAGE
jgi:hypothetical protein